MKNSFPLVILLCMMVSCTGSKKIDLDGFWSLSSSGYILNEPLCCDFELMALYDPYALGSHILIEGDSISLFRYPYEYYGTFKYTISGDSLVLKSDHVSANMFAIQKPDENTIHLDFEEQFTPTCLLNAEAKYEKFTPDSAIINQLIQDSVSYNSLTGQWWYLRKEITYEDGAEPTVLLFPKGMPDSIFVSQEMINKNVPNPFIELKLDNRVVKMYFKYPSEYSFTLKPEFEKDEVLFIDFIDYGEYGGIDTIYREVIYYK